MVVLPNKPHYIINLEAKELALLPEGKAFKLEDGTVAYYPKTIKIHNAYVAYYRLSKQKFFSDGTPVSDPLGIDSQKYIVRNFVKTNKGVLLSEFTEIQSGYSRSGHKREIIYKALNMARLSGATLIFAYVDRIARDVEFTGMLRNSGVKFICCDAPHANELTINIMAAMAQEYSRSISEKTKNALAELKKRGVPLGVNAHKIKPDGTRKLPPIAYIRSANTRRIKAATNPKNIANKNRCFYLWQLGYTIEQITFVMNSEGYTTAKNKPIYKNLVERYVTNMIHEHDADKHLLQQLRSKQITE